MQKPQSGRVQYPCPRDRLGTVCRVLSVSVVEQAAHDSKYRKALVCVPTCPCDCVRVQRIEEPIGAPVVRGAALRLRSQTYDFVLKDVGRIVEYDSEPVEGVDIPS